MRVIAQSKEQPGVFVIGEGPEPRLGDYLWDSKLNKPASQARAYTYVPAFLPPSIERAILVSFTAYLRGESHAASTDAGPRKHHDGRRANAVRDQDRAVVDGGNAGARPRVDPGSPVVRVSQGASVPEARVQSVKGDLPGHEFHGNQYVEGEGGGKERTDEGRGPTLASLNAQADQIIAGLPPKARHVIARDNAVRFLGEKGGFTYDLRGKVPKGGQAISPYKDREHKVDNLTREELMKYEYANRDLLSKPNHYVGGWLNPTDNKVYLDVSIVVHDRKVAEKLATEHGQLAYYDLGSGQTYTVGKADEGTKFVLHALFSKRWAFIRREQSKLLNKTFDPSEPRDEDGKWTAANEAPPARGGILTHLVRVTSQERSDAAARNISVTQLRQMRQGTRMRQRIRDAANRALLSKPTKPKPRKLAPIPPGRKFVVHVSPLSITNGQASLVDKGESEGHPFRGNQYTEGQGGGAEPPSRDEAVAARVAANDLKAKYGEAAKARIAARQHMDERIIDMQNEAIKNAPTRMDEYGNKEYQIAGKWLQGWEVYGAMNAAEDSEYMARKADYDAKIEASDKAERDFEEADTKAKESERLYARGRPVDVTGSEKRLSSTPVSHTNQLGGGVSETLLLTFSDGSKAVFKPEEGEPEDMRSAIEHGYQTEREVGAWEVAKLVGLTDLVAPTVERTLRGQRGSLQEFKEGEVAGDLTTADRYDGHENAIRAAVFDYVIGNQDRHAGNWLVEGDDSMHLIDHGLSFPSVKDHRAQANMDFEDWAQYKSIPKATLTRYGRAYVDNLDKIEAKLTDLGLPRNSIQALRMRVEDLREE